MSDAIQSSNDDICKSLADDSSNFLLEQVYIFPYPMQSGLWSITPPLALKQCLPAPTPSWCRGAWSSLRILGTPWWHHLCHWTWASLSLCSCVPCCIRVLSDKHCIVYQNTSKSQQEKAKSRVFSFGCFATSSCPAQDMLQNMKAYNM